MSVRIYILNPLVLLGCFFVFSMPAVIQADYDDGYYSDRLSREHRTGNDVDEWIERGNATITASPRFDEGARLTAWASKYIQEDDYEFAIASAVYLFEIPPQAQYVEILVRYRGEPNKPYIEDYESIAGRVWIRSTKREYTRHGYDDKHADETRYGDTFVLRAKRRSETIKIPAAGHVDNGFLEMHVVAQDGEQLDIEYIDVVTYRKHRHIHRYNRYARSYQWRPWHRYTYLYFYDGPCYYATDHDYYIRWSYPLYDRHYSAVRYSYGNYLHRYHTYYPTYYYRSYSNPRHIYSGTKSLAKNRRTQLNRWSKEHENVRRQYSRSRLSVARKATKQVNVQPRVRSVIDKHRVEQSTLTDRGERSATVAPKRTRSGYRARSNTLRDRINSLGAHRSANRSSTHQSNKRFYSRDSATDDGKKSSRIRSNAERRSQLYNRSKSYSGRSRVSSSSEVRSRSSSKRTRSEASRPSRTRSTKSSSVSPPSRSRVSAAPSRQSSSASSSDDDDKESRSSSRTRNTERTSRRRSR